MCRYITCLSVYAQQQKHDHHFFFFFNILSYVIYSFTDRREITAQKSLESISAILFSLSHARAHALSEKEKIPVTFSAAVTWVGSW